MRIYCKSLAKFIFGPIQISLCAIEGAESRVGLRGTRIGMGGCPQFPPSLLHASLAHREHSKVVMRVIIFRGDCSEMLELPPRADVVFFQEPDGSEQLFRWRII